MVAKLTDVAELAGVSPTTVSRVINKKGYLSQKTIDKVHAAMQELNYKPNNLARGLQGKSAKLVGLIFPNISNMFYAELIERLEDELFKQGYKTIICNSEHDPRIVLTVTNDGFITLFKKFILKAFNKFSIKHIGDVWENQTNEFGRLALEASSQIIRLVI